MKPPVLLDRAPPAFAAASSWMAGRSRREQILLAVLGGLVIVAGLWLLILQPLLDARATAVSRIAAYETLMVRVRSAGTIGPVVQPLTGPLETALPAQSAPFGITPTVTADGHNVAVAVTGARYESVVAWLAALEASGAVLSSVRIERGAQPGVVNASLSVARP
ncbi:type II secretion system protein GspM [Brevundimonas sp. R86498]|uniref:type II secretion system protein GspM n=1 Tax=Brevundimonas sp. R86498 TaxID=3093845 RepID=UPI0037CBDBC0